MLAGNGQRTVGDVNMGGTAGDVVHGAHVEGVAVVEAVAVADAVDMNIG